MKEGTFRVIFITLILSLSITVTIIGSHPVRADESIYIKADGSIYPSTAPIHRNGNIYVLTDDISGSIVIEKDGIVLNGTNHVLQGTHQLGSIGIDISWRKNVIITKLIINAFSTGIELCNSFNNTIIQNEIIASDSGISLEDSSYNIITENKVIMNYYGIEVYSSSNNNITRNTLTENNYGIYLYSSSNNFLSGNNVTDSTDSGIYLYSSTGNMIIANNIQQSEVTIWTCGIHLEYSAQNGIFGNSIVNFDYGIELSSSSSNTVYHNNFINNNLQVSSGSSINTWNDDYPSGGNYWSDYAGVDEKSGPNQDQPGSDGIGDTAYIINSDNDNYPLMNPYIQTDSTPPLTVTSYDYSWYNTSFSILLFAADDLSGVAHIYYRINGGPIKEVSTNGYPFITEEESTLEYWSIDNANNEETHHVITGIKLDRIPPTGSVLINKDETYTNSPLVTLTLSANDNLSGIAKMRFSNDNSTWSQWETYNVSKSWTLPSGDGVKTVYAQFMDNAGSTSEVYVDSIILDTTPPIISNLSIVPEQNVQPYEKVRVLVNVTDFTSGIKDVTLSYSLNNSATWINLPMQFNSTTSLYEAEVPGQKENTSVKYQIIAYDNAGNCKIEDNNGQYYEYTIVLEFSGITLLIFAIITMMLTIMFHKKWIKSFTKYSTE